MKKIVILITCLFSLFVYGKDQNKKTFDEKAISFASIGIDVKYFITDQWQNNSLATGATPYSYKYGRNQSCTDYGCSQIKVKAPYNSDVIVIIKKGNERGSVIRHAYIRSGGSYTFEIPNGTYQTFFYYGKGWNPNKAMGKVTGGFISDEHFGKDSPQYLNNNILEYELILQRNGNFSTKSSNANEIF